MPIVFWASFEPWLKAMYAAETTWSRRNRSLIALGCARRNTFSSTTMNDEADRRTPSTGDATSGTRTLSRMPVEIQRADARPR